MPRFRIALIKLVVTIAAFDFAAIRATLGSRTGSLGSETGIALLLGALLMANVLAIGILIAQRRPGSRPFLLGFEVFGAMALALFIALAICVTREVVLPYLVPVVGLTDRIIGRGHPFVFIPILCFAHVVMLGWPQVAFALIGGFLSRKYRITITKRTAPTPC
jgi:hypothetical protein